MCINELSEELESIVCPVATEDFSVMGMITTLKVKKCFHHSVMGIGMPTSYIMMDDY